MNEKIAQKAITDTLAGISREVMSETIAQMATTDTLARVSQDVISEKITESVTTDALAVGWVLDWSIISLRDLCTWVP